MMESVCVVDGIRVVSVWPWFVWCCWRRTFIEATISDTLCCSCSVWLDDLEHISRNSRTCWDDSWHIAIVRSCWSCDRFSLASMVSNLSVICLNCVWCCRIFASRASNFCCALWLSVFLVFVEATVPTVASSNRKGGISAEQMSGMGFGYCWLLLRWGLFVEFFLVHSECFIGSVWEEKGGAPDVALCLDRALLLLLLWVVDVGWVRIVAGACCQICADVNCWIRSKFAWTAGVGI